MKLNESATAFLFQTIKHFVNFKSEELEEIASSFKYRIYGKNDYLLKDGQICNFWGFIQNGITRSYSLQDDGEEYTIGFITPGNFISESLSFFKHTASSVNIHALEDTTLIYISYDELQKMFSRFPQFDRFARKVYEDRLMNIKSRMLFRVQLDAAARYDYLIKTHPELIMRVPLKYIASYLGITDSTLSRIRRKMSKITS